MSTSSTAGATASAPSFPLDSSTPAAVAEAPPLVNYFTAPATAERYATGRPSGHARVLQVLPHILAGHLPVARALDVGCGTGHSTRALLPYAQEIMGIDASSEMLAQAECLPRLQYRKGYAEALPCRDASFDLVTVSSAYHWFDHERFLAETARVLRPGGWLVLYKASSTGRPTLHPEFETWKRDVFGARYPKVARNDDPLTRERALRFGFDERWSETLPHYERHTLKDYVENLLTRSNVARVVDGGTESVAEARAWLQAELAPFFVDRAAEFVHESRLHVLQRRAA